MEDLYLKFPDQSTAEEVLDGYEGSVDVIGEIEGVAGYHVNTRGPATLELEAFALNPSPSTPLRTWC